jgi:hypothetical protein
MAVNRSLVESVMTGETAPTEEFVKTLAQLSGVPFGWIQVGNIDSLAGLGAFDGWSADRIRSWLELAVRAEAIGVSADDMAALLNTVGKIKGGA